VTVPRTPDTSADAVLQIAGRIGYDSAAQIVGRKAACIRDWTNEATTSCPSFVQAVALDAAYIAAGGENAPLHDAYAAQLRITVEDRTACARALSSEVATAARECGDLIAASLSVCQAGHSPNDVQRALLEADEAETAVAAIKRRLFSFLRTGAGPVGKAGGSHQ
jgi:hypothetical protein